MTRSVDLETNGVCDRHAPYRALGCPSCLAERPGGYQDQDDRLRVVGAARALLGAPFIYRARAQMRGVDCSGLVICAARTAGLRAPDFDGYPDVFIGADFVGAWTAHCDPIDIGDALPADILLCRTRHRVGHTRLLTERGTTIHSSRKRGVIEEPIDGAFMRTVASVVRLREFGGGR